VIKIIKADLLKTYIKRSIHISEEEMKNVVNLTYKLDIYNNWPSNDMGDDFCIYTGFSEDGETPRYFIKHFNRDWFGGWTYEETTVWYEITEHDYATLSKPNF